LEGEFGDPVETMVLLKDWKILWFESGSLSETRLRAEGSVEALPRLEDISSGPIMALLSKPAAPKSLVIFS
jgi:hypothetical protein